jgi:hypothetical protein
MTVETSANEMGGAVTNYKVPFFRKGDQDPTIFLYFSVVSSFVDLHINIFRPSSSACAI